MSMEKYSFGRKRYNQRNLAGDGVRRMALPLSPLPSLPSPFPSFILHSAFSGAPPRTKGTRRLERDIFHLFFRLVGPSSVIN